VVASDSNAERTTERSGFSQSLERGLSVLDAFAGMHSTLGIAEIAREVGLNKSTTHRYVNTLAVLGYLHQDPESRKYRLGARAVEIGFAALNSIEITRIAAGPLQRLADETGFTVSMAVLDGPEIVYIERRRTGQDRQLDLNLQVGSRLPAYCTALGKVLLAAEQPAQLRALLDRIDLARRAPNTITAREHLLAALDRIRRGAVAVNDEELTPGLRAIAVPVRDRSRRVVAAINIAVHTTGWNASPDALMRRLEPALRRTAADISGQLGFREHAS
jgi:IclR family transcriptional regulator, pca regulon regulatory protein